MKRYLTVVLLTALCMLQSCNEQQVACTEEYRTIGIRVIGEALDEHFTIRVATSDTIRQEDNGGFPDEYYYVVLTDSYQPEFAGSRESFQFIGKQGGITVVDEVFVIKADQCHINYISGTMEVTL